MSFLLLFLLLLLFDLLFLLLFDLLFIITNIYFSLLALYWTALMLFMLFVVGKEEEEDVLLLLLLLLLILLVVLVVDDNNRFVATFRWCYYGFMLLLFLFNDVVVVVIVGCDIFYVEDIKLKLPSLFTSTSPNTSSLLLLPLSYFSSNRLNTWNTTSNLLSFNEINDLGLFLFINCFEWWYPLNTYSTTSLALPS